MYNTTKTKWGAWANDGEYIRPQTGETPIEAIMRAEKSNKKIKNTIHTDTTSYNLYNLIKR